MDPDYLSRAKPQGARFVKDHFDGKKLVWTIKHILFWESQTCHPIRLTTLSWRVLYGFFYEISYLSDDENFLRAVFEQYIDMFLLTEQI